MRILITCLLFFVSTICLYGQEMPNSKNLFGDKFNGCDNLATGQWWKRKPNKKKPMPLKVDRDQVIAFAVYTHDRGQLKLSAQLFPLMPDEPREAQLEFKQDDGTWKEVAKEEVQYPGWSAHFRIKDWDNTKDVVYRVHHGEAATFEGLIRKDPIDKDVIVVGNMSCNLSLIHI